MMPLKVSACVLEESEDRLVERERERKGGGKLFQQSDTFSGVQTGVNRWFAGETETSAANVSSGSPICLVRMLLTGLIRVNHLICSPPQFPPCSSQFPELLDYSIQNG